MRCLLDWFPRAMSLPFNVEERADAMHKAVSDLNANTKQAAIQLLNARVADSIDLALLTKQAHWNLKGPQFIAVQEMLDGFRTQIDGHVDTMSEHVVQFGGTALGTAQTVVQSTTLSPYPTDIYAIRSTVLR